MEDKPPIGPRIKAARRKAGYSLVSADFAPELASPQAKP